MKLRPALISALSVGSFVACVEIGLRILIALSPIDIKAYHTNDYLYAGHPFSAYRLKENFNLNHFRGAYSNATKAHTEPLNIHINSLSFRGPEMSAEKPRGTFRIFCLGGSSVWGLDLPDKDTWPQVLEKKVKKQIDESVEIINAGVPGHSTFHSLGMLYSQILDYNPDLIIVSHSWNDVKYFAHVSPSKSYWQNPLSNDYRNSWLRELSKQSYTYRFVQAIISRLQSLWEQKGGVCQKRHETFAAQARKVKDISYGLGLFERNLRSMVALCRIHGVQLVFANPLTLVKPDSTKEEKLKIAYDATGLTFTEMVSAFEKIDQIYQKVSAEETIPYINLNQQISSDLQHLMDHIHPTAEGAEAIAGVLAEFLERNNLIKSKSGEV